MIKTEYTINTNSLKLATKIITGSNNWNILFLGGYASDMKGKKAHFLADLAIKLGSSAVFFDYSGHGESEGNFSDGTIGSWFDDTCIIFDKYCRKKNTIIIGSSMGGWLAMLLAKKYTNLIFGMILLAPAFDFPKRLILPNLNDKEISILNRVGQIALPSGIPTEPDIIFTKKLYDESYHHNILDSKEKIDLNCKVRIIQGLKDTDVPWQHALLCDKCVSSPDLQIIMLSDGDHRLSTNDNLQRLKTEVSEMLQSLS